MSRHDLCNILYEATIYISKTLLLRYTWKEEKKSMYLTYRRKRVARVHLVGGKKVMVPYKWKND